MKAMRVTIVVILMLSSLGCLMSVQAKTPPAPSLAPVEEPAGGDSLPTEPAAVDTPAAALAASATSAPLDTAAPVADTAAPEVLPSATDTPSPLPPAAVQADNPNPPASPLKLIFIHHSTGGNWLADLDQHASAGGLGRALMENNYYVSATNYGWGPDSIGDRTDLGNWWEWFNGPNSATYLAALYAENEQNFGDFGSWPRLDADPGGENVIVMFKSCFPNSQLGGSPNDPPTTGDNPLRGMDSSAGDEIFNVANAKGIYNDLLTYFATRQDRLFVVITAPPLLADETDAAHAANARAFNNWLVNDWLDAYTYSNVAVFDFYNVLTSSGGNVDVNDLGQESGNHHRWWNGALQHTQTVANNFSAYAPPGDSHPNTAGGQKATGEFVSWLNVQVNRWTGEAPSPSLKLHLPLITNGTPTPPPAGDLLQTSDFTYLGAFRLPDDGERPRTFAYGGNAMTFNPAGDSSGAQDGFAGSLFITGHDRLPYGELPDGSQVAEVDIPLPVISRNLADLNTAGFLQGFQNVAAGFFSGLDEIPRLGLAYLDTPATGPKLHLAWGQHLQPDPPVASHAWFDLDLSTPNLQGTWFIGERSLYSVNGYLFEIPAAWADANASGRYLAGGRFRDGGWSGMGPALFAYRPWVDASGTPAASGTHLPETTLLLYASSQDTTAIEHAMTGYQHPDEWEGGAWLTTAGGRSAVIFAGTKSIGVKYWYGFLNPAGPDQPCIAQDMLSDFTVCRLADGSACPAADMVECPGHTSYRGWWSTAFAAQIIFYNPADLAKVAAGQLASWEPQPYAVLNLDSILFHNPQGIEAEMLGTGVQRRYRIGDIAYDRAHSLLYILELFADDAKPAVHVWRIGAP